MHGILRTLGTWQEILKDELAVRAPAPLDFIPGCFIETDAKGPAIHKYRSLLEKSNTPFSPIQASAAPARRLWNYLVRQEAVQEIFIRAVFGKKRGGSSTVDGNSTAASVAGDTGSASGKLFETCSPRCEHLFIFDYISVADHHSSHHNGPVQEPVRIIHKDQESISAFCINNVNPGLITLATPREVQEMDISLLLESPNWMEDECELDILNLNKDIDSLPSSNFLVIQAASDK